MFMAKSLRGLRWGQPTRRAVSVNTGLAAVWYAFAMTIDPLAAAPILVQVHVYTVLPAALIGFWLIAFSPKGSLPHRVLGGVYLALLAVATVSALGIQELNDGAFSLIHLLILPLLWGLWAGWRAARRGDVAAHKKAMVAVYIVGIVITGGFTLLSGRLMNQVVFG
jgi:uncharacterized membrane protein